MRKHQVAAIAAALLFAGQQAVAQDANKAPTARTEPSQIDRAAQDVKAGAQQAGREVKQGARAVGREVKQGAQEVGSGAKKGWQEFKHSAAEFGRSVKGFFSRLWNG